MKTIFTIVHTNDMHSNLIGMGPASDYTPLTVNDDKTTGGYARIATVIATRKKARESQGPVLILDAGDYSMGTPFAAASRPVFVQVRPLTLSPPPSARMVPWLRRLSFP